MELVLKKFSFFYAIILLGLFFSVTASANEADIGSLIKKGLDNCYHFRWKDAGQDFQTIISRYPDDPRGYHYRSSIFLWFYLSSKDEKDLETFLNLSDAAIEKGDRILDNDPENSAINYTLGNAYSYRTLAYAKSESYLNAIWSSKKSETLLKKVIETDSRNYDAYLGLGLYNFAAAQIPSAFRWALNLAGISGDEDTGLEYIALTAEKGNLSKIEAQYYLSQLLTNVTFNYQRARDLLLSIHNKYPGNILFSYGLAVVYIKQKIPEKAERLLINIARFRDSKFRQVTAFSNFLLGDIFFRMNDFPKAINYYKKFIAATPEKDYKGIASYRTALCYELSGDRNTAIEYFRLGSSGNPDLEDDTYAARKSKIFLKNSLSQDQSDLIRFSNFIEAGKFSQASDSLINLADRTKNSSIKAETYYFLSEAAFYRGMFGESVDFALKGSKIPVGEEGWVTSFCFYNAARGAFKKGIDPTGFIESAEDNNKWDYQKQIENLLKYLKRQ